MKRKQFFLILLQIFPLVSGNSNLQHTSVQVCIQKGDFQQPKEFYLLLHEWICFVLTRDSKTSSTLKFYAWNVLRTKTIIFAKRFYVKLKTWKKQNVFIQPYMIISVKHDSKAYKDGESCFWKISESTGKTFPCLPSLVLPKIYRYTVEVMESDNIFCLYMNHFNRLQ